MKSYHTPYIDHSKAADHFMLTGKVNFSSGLPPTPQARNREFISQLPAFTLSQPTQSLLAFSSSSVLKLSTQLPLYAPPKPLEIPKLIESSPSNQIYTHALIDALKTHDIKVPDKETQSYHEALLMITKDKGPPKKTNCYQEKDGCVDLYYFDGVATVTHPKLFLGRGVGGEVSLHLTSEGKQLAVKKIIITDWYDTQRYAKEIMINNELGTFHGSGTVNISHDPVMQQEGYVAMEYHHGETLRKYLLKNNMGNNQAITLMLMKEISLAVKELHNKNIVHHDLNQGNMIVNLKNENGKKVKPIDFEYASRPVTVDTPHHDSHTSEAMVRYYYYQKQFESDLLRMSGMFINLYSQTKFTSPSVKAEVERIAWGLEHHNTPAEHVVDDIDDLISNNKPTWRPF